jgi:hypothetical protein
MVKCHVFSGCDLDVDGIPELADFQDFSGIRPNGPNRTQAGLGVFYPLLGASR